MKYFTLKSPINMCKFCSSFEIRSSTCGMQKSRILNIFLPYTTHAHIAYGSKMTTMTTSTTAKTMRYAWHCMRCGFIMLQAYANAYFVVFDICAVYSHSRSGKSLTHSHIKSMGHRSHTNNNNKNNNNLFGIRDTHACVKRKCY